MSITETTTLIAIVAVVVFIIGFVVGKIVTNNKYDSYQIIVEKSADLPCAEVNRVFKEQLEVMLIKENLVNTVRDQHTVTKSFKFYIKPVDNE